ncbi:hypothetical protein EZS27_015938 [termite gut metagenome]|uniref:Uncharacterized protein n=1 Tax=termite gut metagenome TaxID=433724 RepID=A0A5J4RSA4_9ZZZZ
MKKETTQKITDIIPDALSNIADWLKDNFEENGREILNSASVGSIGLVIKFFGKPLVDRYFIKQTEKKLENFGTLAYIEAAYKQAALSIEKIEKDIKTDKTPEEVLNTFSNITTLNFEAIDNKNILLLFQPVYHPIVQSIKKNYVEMLENLCIEESLIKKFIKDYNENIEATIKEVFATDYEKHISEIDSFLLEKNESKLLFETYQLSKIGFDSSENLKYEETYGSWKEVSKFREDDFLHNKSDAKELGDIEEKLLFPIKDLIHEYFGDNSDNIKKVLFIIADFGKGKSIFMRHYASELAKKYMEHQGRVFPCLF